jgi:hypothetical protein
MQPRTYLLALVAASALLGALPQSASAPYYDRRYYDDRGPPPPPPGYYEERRYYREGPPPGYREGPPPIYREGPPPGYRDAGPPAGFGQGGPPQERRGMVACAREHGYCGFQGRATVLYGANGRFARRQAVNGIACNNQNFGDPAPGQEKACFLD